MLRSTAKPMQIPNKHIIQIEQIQEWQNDVKIIYIDIQYTYKNDNTLWHSIKYICHKEPTTLQNDFKSLNCKDKCYKNLVEM